MPTKKVTPKPDLFSVGAAVQAFPARTSEVERREHRLPFPDAAASGVIGSDGTVEITAAAGDYVLFLVTNEVQSVKVDATAKQFKLKYSGQTTADIAFNATAAKVREELEALSNIGAGEVEVTGGPGDSGGTKPYVVTFLKGLAGTNVAQLEYVEGTEKLTGGGATVTITTTTAGTRAPAGGTPRTCAFTIDAE